MVVSYPSPDSVDKPYDLDADPIAPSRWWSTSIGDIFEDPNRRLDARFYDPTSEIALAGFRNAGIELRPLSEFARVDLPGQFTRIWADDEANGLPYLNSTDLLSLMAIGSPAGGQRFLSFKTEVDIERLVIRTGWLLVTCSGTIGRIFHVPNRLDGWAATHDLIRVIPKNEKHLGFLYAYLNSNAAQLQLLKHTHGGQIDHVTEEQVAGCLVPSFSDEVVAEIGASVDSALNAREAAIATLVNAWPNR